MAALLALAGCSPAGQTSDEPTSQTAAALTGQNGIWQNGLTTNGIWQNGIWQNGIWQNGIWQNGIWQNGIWQNGIWQNGIWQNGIWQNGIWQNGIWQNGIWQNGIWQNGLWEGNLAARDLLRDNPNAGKLLQYIYSCAMPAGATKTLDPKTLDPNGADVLLEGSIGLAPQWDTEGGTCNESCQRWISACVLARTNAYGVNVSISMRAPDDAPAAIKAALATTSDERSIYSKREGAYYGNIFATTPEPNTPGPNGTSASVVVNTPSLYACAGPASNIPAITKRFCSSQGDNGPITPVGTCLTQSSLPSACSGIGDPISGAVRGCFTSTNPSAPRTLYKEVITVYLNEPISVCGNSVCEEAEDDPAITTFCPSDCHPDGWAQSFNVNFGAAGLGLFLQGVSAVSPVDDTVVIAGLSGVTITLGGEVLPFDEGNVVVAKFASDGTYVWGRRFDMPLADRVTLAIDDDGGIALAGWFAHDSPLHMARLSAEGAIVTPPLALGGPTLDGSANGENAVDSQGNVVMVGDFAGTATFATTPPTTFTRTAEPDQFARDAFVVKVDADDQPLWAVQIGGLGSESPSSLALDPEGNVLLALDLAQTTVNATSSLFKLSRSTGAVMWRRNSPAVGSGFYFTPGTSWVAFKGVAADAQGEVYATGFFQGSYDFGPGCGIKTANMRDFFVVKYSADGTQCRWIGLAGTHCPPDATFCNGLFGGNTLAFDHEGNVIVGGRLDGVNMPPFPPPPPGLRGPVIDFGAGVFDNYRFPDVFIAAYNASSGAFRWAKQVPIVLQGSIRGLDVDSEGHIVLAGTYSGSLTVDDRFLVNTNPQELNSANTYLASFKPPSPSDGAPPEMQNVPDTIVLEATSSQGATGWFMPPTAIDTGYSGAKVSCSERPWSTFPIGTTTVTCVATDPLGNESEPESFDIIVRDTIGPMLNGIPRGGFVVGVQPGDDSAIATYPVPNAVDQIDGSLPVTCSPSSGTEFALGATTVLCSASDASGNQSTTSFLVRVVEDTTPPVLTLPSGLEVVATSAEGAVVNYSASATDDLDGPVPVQCSPVSGSQFSLGTTTVHCSASDASGNPATGSFQVSVVAPPPELVLPGPISVVGTSALGAVVTYSASATDYQGNPLVPVCTPASGSLFAYGTTTVTCTATDADDRQSTGTFGVQVQYAWSGILQPIDADGSSIFKLGSTVSVKFSLTGGSAGITDAVATLTLAKISQTVTGTDSEAISNSEATSGNLFRYDASSSQYVFNLGTKNLSVGTWRLTIDLGDGVSRTVLISLKK